MRETERFLVAAKFSEALVASSVMPPSSHCGDNPPGSLGGVQDLIPQGYTLPAGADAVNPWTTLGPARHDSWSYSTNITWEQTVEPDPRPTGSETLGFIIPLDCVSQEAMSEAGFEPSSLWFRSTVVLSSKASSSHSFSVLSASFCGLHGYFKSYSSRNRS
jgi:hypothetical protein